ncbi:hypothetical protein [Psychrobacter sp. JB193]|uniref:hypothetical protein n=1 Tax=Psychrobacter sp. JB193 TaxID=2024406 RepID=UPI000BAAFB90|nr:hypothetical protein [Psychrobacter sp. JB193]PAT63077.1 hypothetical protein CIK80_11020 [Psychrobacter sp. JB193]
MGIEQYDHQEVVRQTVAKLSSHLISPTDKAGLSHSQDISTAKGLLKEMVKRGVIYTADEISYTAEHEFHWHKKDATELGKLAEKISNGSRVQGADTEAGQSKALQIFQELDDLPTPK